MTNRLNAMLTRKRKAPRRKIAFGEWFELAFRKHPLVIGCRLIIGGFVAGFGAGTALIHVTCIDQPCCDAAHLLQEKARESR